MALRQLVSCGISCSETVPPAAAAASAGAAAYLRARRGRV
jgi:hypothetical protein